MGHVSILTLSIVQRARIKLSHLSQTVSRPAWLPFKFAVFTHSVDTSVRLQAMYDIVTRSRWSLHHGLRCIHLPADVVARALATVAGDGLQRGVVSLLAVRDAAVGHLGDLVAQITGVPASSQNC